MRMNRRSFSAAMAATGSPGAEKYPVILFSSTTGEDYVWGNWPDGLYGEFSPGETVAVDLNMDSTVNVISNVEPYDIDTAGNVEDVVYDGDLAVSFIMPAFAVAVLIETRY